MKVVAAAPPAPSGRTAGLGSFEYGFSAGQTPAGVGDVRAVLDQVAACSFEDVGGDRPAAFQGGVVARVLGFAGQAVHGLVDALAPGTARSGGAGGSFECGDGLLRAPARRARA